jgi:hypothetical protein
MGDKSHKVPGLKFVHRQRVSRSIVMVEKLVSSISQGIFTACLPVNSEKLQYRNVDTQFVPVG